MNEKQLLNLSKTISYALRHKPEEFSLVLDENGWVDIDDLIKGLKNHSFRYNDVTFDDIVLIVNTDQKKRYEIKQHLIRAVYGHSTVSKINKKATEPPEFLYHGTKEQFLSQIDREGLKPMSRQYVHLSEETDTAKIVANRRKGSSVILTIKAKEAFKKGINFYKESTGIWLSDSIPSEYIIK